MAFFNIEKTNNNNQNTFFNQNPNMMGNNQPDMYNNQGMMNNNMNSGFGQGDYNQGMNPQNDMGYNSGMGMPDMYNNQGMMNNNMNPGFGQVDYNQGMSPQNDMGYNPGMGMPDMYNNQGMMNNNMNTGFGQVDYNQGMNPQNDMGYNSGMNGMSSGFGQTDYNSGMSNTNDAGFNQNMNSQNDMGYNSGMNNMSSGFGQTDYNSGMSNTNNAGFNQNMNSQNDMGYNSGMNNMSSGFGPTDYNSEMSNTNNAGFNQNMNPQNDMGYSQGMELPSMNNSQTMEIPVMNNNQGMGNDGSSYLPPKSNIPPAPSLFNNDSPKMNNGPVIKPGGQGELSKFEEDSNNSTMAPNNMGGELSKYEVSDAKKESPISFEDTKKDSQPSLEDETKNALDYYNNKDIKKEEEAEGIVHEDIETLEIEEVQLPREIEKEMELSGGLKKEEPKGGKKAKDEKAIDNSEKDFANQILSSMDKYQDVEDIGEQKDVKANIFAAFGIILGMIVKPGTTMLKNAKRFKKMDKAGFIMLWLAVIFLVVCIVVRIGVGSFDRSYSSLSDSYKLVFNPGRIFELSNYLEFLLISVSLSVGGVLLVALIYYASSFMNSKGVHFATYLIVSNLAMIPLLVGSIVLYPVAVIFSGYLGLGALIFSFLATLITLLIGMNEVLTFKNVNNQIFYHVINLSVITLVAIIVFVFMVQKNWVILPVMNI